MIQVGTYLNVIDNSGAKKVYCIRILNGYRKRYATVGDVIIVSVKRLRAKRRLSIRLKKGEIFKALIVRTKSPLYSYNNEKLFFNENAVVLLTKQNKLFATRIFGALPRMLRYTKFSRIVSLSSGIV